MTSRLKGFLCATLGLIAASALLCAVFLGSPGALAIGAFIGTVFSLPAMLLLGVPAHLLLARAGMRSLRAYLWAGFGISAALAFLGAATLPHGGARMVVQLFEIFTVLVCGPLAAGIFWFAARPDRPTAAPPA